MDASILLYAVDEESPFHDTARQWLEAALNGPRRVAIPWVSLAAFIRIVTNPRALRNPLTPGEAWEHVADWLDAPAVWIPQQGRGYASILERLLVDLDLRGNLVADAVLAAICIEHGLEIVSADSDFARFQEIAWTNPVAGDRR